MYSLSFSSRVFSINDTKIFRLYKACHIVRKLLHFKISDISNAFAEKNSFSCKDNSERKESIAFFLSGSSSNSTPIVFSFILKYSFFFSSSLSYMFSSFPIKIILVSDSVIISEK